MKYKAKPRYPQNSYWGRIRHFIDVTDPRYLDFMHIINNVEFNKNSS